jgi:protease-4
MSGLSRRRRRVAAPRRKLASCAWEAAGLALGLLSATLPGCDTSPRPSRHDDGRLRAGLDTAASGVVVDFDLTHGVSEQAAQLSLLSSASAPSLSELVLAFGRARDDNRTRGFLLRLGEADLSWAQAEELGRLFASLKPEQPVVCHAHAYSNTLLFFAARACDRLWLSPAGEVGTVGIAGQMLYLKRLLDRFKVKADFLHMGRYKSAAESVTQDGPSDEARESLISVLSSIRQTWLDGVASARPGEKLRQALEHGPWSPEAALSQGLVDAIGYVSDARNDAKQRSGTQDVESRFGAQSRRNAAQEITHLIRVVSGASATESAGDHIIVLPTSGGISMEAGSVLGGSDGIAAEPLGKTLRRLRDNDSVKAVVIRIDSPGGSALASDLIWHELMLLRDKKPLIASLAGTAASGGYYMACAATRIVAERTSIIGSIGVVGGKIVAGEALNELGVSSVTFAASNEPGAAARAAYLSPLSEWDDPTRESVRAQMSAIYELFLARVAAGRSLPVDDVRKIAEGRIWSGEQGLGNHLIDEFGGLTEAIELAKKQAHLDPDIEVKIEGGPESLLELLNIDSNEGDPEAHLEAALARLRSAPPSPLESLAAPLRPYAASLAPLLGKERVLAAIPFALELK